MRHEPATAARPALSDRVRGIRDIAPESVLVLAGGRAILLQLANPAVGHGVARHSDFVSRPLARLHGTLSYVYAVTCGTPIDRAAAVRRVALAHRPVHSDPADHASAHHGAAGPAYNAFDPGLQLWVAATLYESATRMHDLVYGPLADADAESVYRDYGVLGTALQVPAGLWPADRAAFAEYWQRSRARLRVDDASLRVSRDLLHPVAAPLWLRAAMPLARFLTAGFLDAELRASFGLPWSDRHDRRFARTLRVMRAVYPRLPGRVRHWPARHYLLAFRSGAGHR